MTLPPLEPPVLESDLVRVRPLREEDAPLYAAAVRDDPQLGLMAGFEIDPDEQSLRRKVPEIAEHARLGSRLQRGRRVSLEQSLLATDPAAERL